MKSFIPLPQNIFKTDYSDLGASSLKLLAGMSYLAKGSDTLQIDLRSLVDFMGMSHPTIQKCKNELIKKSLISIEQKHSQFSATKYKLNHVKPLKRSPSDKFNFEPRGLRDHLHNRCFSIWLDSVEKKINMYGSFPHYRSLSQISYRPFYDEKVKKYYENKYGSDYIYHHYYQLVENGIIPEFIEEAPIPEVR